MAFPPSKWFFQIIEAALGRKNSTAAPAPHPGPEREVVSDPAFFFLKIQHHTRRVRVPLKLAVFAYHCSLRELSKTQVPLLTTLLTDSTSNPTDRVA